MSTRAARRRAADGVGRPGDAARQPVPGRSRCPAPIALQPVTYSCPPTPAPSCYERSFTAEANLQVTFANPPLPNGQYSFGSGTSPVTQRSCSIRSPTATRSSPATWHRATRATSRRSPQATPPSSIPGSRQSALRSPRSRTPPWPCPSTTSPSSSHRALSQGHTLTATEQGGSSVTYSLNTPSRTERAIPACRSANILLGETGGGPARARRQPPTCGSRRPACTSRPRS